MAELETTKLSSKGQIVLPKEIREVLNLKEGSILVTIRKDNMIILKKIESHLLEDEINTLKNIEEAWREIEEGKFKKMRSEEFLREIRTW